MYEEEDSIYPSIEMKVVLIGESGVGKSSIIRQFVNKVFDDNIEASISTKYFTKEIKIESKNKKIRYNLWDTAGQERYRSLAKIFYNNANVIVFVYNIINQKSFEELKNYWYKEVKHNSPSDTIYAVIGNKNDLYDENKVNNNEAKEWANSINAIFQLTSAKTNSGIDLLFENIGMKFIDPDYNYLKDDEEYKAKYGNKKKKKKGSNQNDDVNDDDNDNDNGVKESDMDSFRISIGKKRKKKKCC